jgi:hypothetical protein
MANKKVPFKGKGFKWFPMMQHFVGTKSSKGMFFEMTSSPELRLYMALLAESDVAGSHEFELSNQHLREFADLDRHTLNNARKALDAYALVRSVKTGKETYRYEILGDGGKSMSDKIAYDNVYFMPPDEAEAA